MMSCSKYSIPIKIITTTPFDLYGNGTYWFMYVEDGDKSYSHHQTVSSSKFSAHPDVVSERISISGQPFPSFFFYISSRTTLMKTMLLLHSSTTIVYVVSMVR